MSSSRHPRRPTFESSSDDDEHHRKPWQLCGYCRRLAATAAEATTSRAAAMPADRYSVENLAHDEDALKYAKTLRRLTRMKSTRRSSISTLRGFPVTITDINDHDGNSLFVKWCIHDDENVSGFEFYVDNDFHSIVDNPKRTSAVLENINPAVTHSVQLKVKPIVDKFPTASGVNGDDEPLDKCTCNWGRILLRKSQQLSEDLQQWNPSTYIYSPNN